MIDRPHLLSLVEQTTYLDPHHPLKRWASNETIIEQDEFELDEWPERSIDALLDVTADIRGDPYLKALEIALKLDRRAHPSPFPAEWTVRDVYAATSQSAKNAVDPLLQLLVANQAIAVSHRVSRTQAQEFDLLCWEQGLRLTDTGPLYVSFYLSTLWQHWNSFPRDYALSHITVPRAKDLLLHLSVLDGGRFEHLRRQLMLKANLETLISDLSTSSARASMEACLDLRADLYELLKLLESGEEDPDSFTYHVNPGSLDEPCHDLAMAMLHLKQYQSSLELLQLSLRLMNIDDAEDIGETVSIAISDLGLIDADI